MSAKVLVLNGSPVRNGNTSALCSWFSEGCAAAGAVVKTVELASLSLKANGCLSCRRCQNLPEYGCVLGDGAAGVLTEMAGADVIVMASPLYFFSASAQLKVVLDRMFSLYKWDNASGTMRTLLKGKMLVVLASAFEAAGLDALERPFSMTAEYTGMRFKSLLVPHAGESGGIARIPGIREKARALGEEVVGEIA